MKAKDEIQEEALREIQHYERCGVGISMGVGKTLLGIKDMLGYPDGNFLVVVPKNSVIETWKAEAMNNNLEYLLERIEFTTYVSLHKQHLDYVKIYLDECHSLTANNVNFLKKYRGSILGLTGTPPKVGDKKKYVDEFCPIVYTYIVDEAVSDSILNDYQIIVHYLSLDHTKNIFIETKKGYTFRTSEVENYRYLTERIDTATNQNGIQFARIMRMKGMMSYKSKEVYAKELFNSIEDKCLIFANTQEQADNLCKHSYHSGNPNSAENLEMFSNGTITKLSAVLQLNEGINIPNLKQSIILHAYGNERKFSQRLGRCLRLPVDEKAIVHVLCYVNTVDEQWLNRALSTFDEDKIVRLDHEFVR